MTAAPAALIAAVSAPNPPYTITAGKGPLPLGRSTPAENDALRPLCETFTVICVRDTVPVTLAGRPGFSPYTNRSASLRISARRHRHSSRVLIRRPSSRTNGSGNRATDGNDPSPGNAGTGQSAPSSSTAAATAGDDDTTAIAPAATSTTTPTSAASTQPGP